MLLVVVLLGGCRSGSKTATLPEGVPSDLTILSLGADTSELTADQVALLQQTINWMNRDMIRSFQRQGFNTTQITEENEFKGAGNSHLLKISITSHRMIPKGARMWGGMMAGSDRLNAHYDLVNASGKIVLSWDDVQASSKGGTYCARTLNRNATNKVVAFLSGA